MFRAVLLLTRFAHCLAAVHMVNILHKGRGLGVNAGDPFNKFLCMWFGNLWIEKYQNYSFVPPSHDRPDLIREDSCDDVPGAQFLISDDPVSTIRPALRPDFCVEAPESMVQPSSMIFKPCGGYANQSFSLPRLSTFYHYSEGNICSASNPAFCLGSFQSIESCSWSFGTSQHHGPWVFGAYVIGISDITSSNASADTRTVNLPWNIITAHPDMWLGSRVTEAFVFKALMFYLILCVTAYAAYLLKKLCQLVFMIRSIDASTSWLRKRCIESVKVLRRSCRGTCTMFGIGSSDDQVARVMTRRRLQRAHVHSRRLAHVFSIYAGFKAKQLLGSYLSSIECSDAVRACDASTARMHVYNYELLPLLTMAYPASCVLAVLGNRLRPWLCDMLIVILSVGWFSQKVFSHTKEYGVTEVRILCCRIVLLIILGNPRLAAICEVIVALSVEMYTYGVCSATPRRPFELISNTCPDQQTFLGYFFQGNMLARVEVLTLWFVATCVYYFDSFQAKEILEKREADARDLALSMLQRHLDVLYDCVAHLGGSLEISIGSPKLAGLLMRGPISNHSLKNRHFVDLIAEGDRQRFAEHMKNASLTDRVSVLNVSLVDSNGGLVACELFTSSATDAEGTISYLIGIKEVVHDIGVPHTSPEPLLAHETTACTFDHEVEPHGDVSREGMSRTGTLNRETLDRTSNPSEIKSNSSVAQTESSLGVEELRLTLVWGEDDDPTVVGCTREVSLALGKELEGSLCNELELEDPSEICEWMQQAIWSWTKGLIVQPCKLTFRPSRWRPRMSATAHLEDFQPPVGETIRFTMRLCGLRKQSYLGKEGRKKRSDPLRPCFPQIQGKLSL